MAGDKGGMLLILRFRCRVWQCCLCCELGEKASSLCKGASGRTAGFWQLRRFRGLLVLWEVCSCLGVGGCLGGNHGHICRCCSQSSAVPGAQGQISPHGATRVTEQCPRAGPCWQTKKAHLCPFCLRSALPEKPTPFQYPPGWPPLQELPPSLRAPPPGGWPVPPGLQWG